MKAPGESAGISASALALLAPGWPHGLSCPLGHGGLSLCKIVLDPVDCLAGPASSAGDGVSSDLLNPSPPRRAHERYARLGEGVLWNLATCGPTQSERTDPRTNATHIPMNINYITPS